MKRLIIAFISILMLASVVSGTATSITIYGTNKSNAQSNITCYGCNQTISVQAWNTSYVKNISVHSRNGSGGDAVSFNISNVTAYQVQELKVNGTAINAYQAGANGMLNFSYTIIGNRTLTLSPASKINGYNFTWGWFWTSPKDMSIGSYSGDGTGNRAVPHNLATTPRTVMIIGANDSTQVGLCIYNGGVWRVVSNTVDAIMDTTDADTTNFYIGTGTTYCQNTGLIYNWTAWS